MPFDLKARLLEIPYRLRRRPRYGPATWPIEDRDRRRVQITWPTNYQWKYAGGMTESVQFGLASLGVIRRRRMEQSHPGIVMLECVVDGRMHRIAIDYADHSEFLNRDALAASDLYFKMQFRSEGYSDAKILRGGYVVSQRNYYQFYSAYRARYSEGRRADLLGRFSLEFQRGLRQRAIDLLRAEPGLGFVGGSVKVRYSQFLREAASARLCLDLPGNGAFTYRLPEVLGLGSCLIAPRYPNSLHVDLESGVHYVAIAPDLSDLVDACRYYVAHGIERERIARAGSDYFDRYLHRAQLGSYYLRTILDRLGPARASPAA